MIPPRCLLFSALLALPVAAGIKSMSLHELLTHNTDVVHGTIVDKGTFSVPEPGGGSSVWTHLRVVGESLAKGGPIELDALFRGSHSPQDGYWVTEMPNQQDTRVGGEIVIFYHHHHDDLLGESDVLHGDAEIYRVEEIFGVSVVVGKGAGAAFPENKRLSDVRTEVQAAWGLLTGGAR